MDEPILHYTDGTEKHGSPRNAGKRIYVDSKGKHTDANDTKVEDAEKNKKRDQ